MVRKSLMVIELPWPPSVNHYWRRNGSRYYVSSEGQAYRNSLYSICAPYRGVFERLARLSLIIEAYPPDRRRRDLDNLIKAVQDSLQYAGIYEDDSQIDFLAIKRNNSKDNKIIITLSVIIDDARQL